MPSEVRTCVFRADARFLQAALGRTRRNGGRMQSKFHDDTNRHEQKQWSGVARPKGDVYAEQDDQWAVLRHEVEVEDMRWQEKQGGPELGYEQRDTDRDAHAYQMSYNELEYAHYQVDIVVVYTRQSR